MKYTIPAIILMCAALISTGCDKNQKVESSASAEPSNVVAQQESAANPEVAASEANDTNNNEAAAQEANPQENAPSENNAAAEDKSMDDAALGAFFEDESPRPFRFTVSTAEAEKYTIPLVKKNDYDIKLPANEEKQYQVNYDLDCDEDGIYEKTNQKGDVVCELTEGIHHIAIRGTIPGIHFNTGKINPKTNELVKPINTSVISIDQWGDNAWRNLSKMFDCEPADLLVDSFDTDICVKGGCGKRFKDIRQYNARDIPNLKNIRKLSCVGGAYTDYHGSFADWDVSNITDMSDMFRGNTVYDTCMSCTILTGGFNQDISRWNTSNVTDMSGMFIGCTEFNQPIGKWDTSNVTDMSGMFTNASSFNQPLESWNTSKVKDMSAMFMYAFAFDQPLDKWDVSSVKNMKDMFYEANSFSHYPSSWVIPKSSLKGMFEGTNVPYLDEELPLKQPLKTKKNNKASLINCVFMGGTRWCKQFCLESLRNDLDFCLLNSRDSSQLSAFFSHTR